MKVLIFSLLTLVLFISSGKNAKDQVGEAQRTPMHLSIEKYRPDELETPVDGVFVFIAGPACCPDFNEFNLNWTLLNLQTSLL